MRPGKTLQTLSRARSRQAPGGTGQGGGQVRGRTEGRAGCLGPQGSGGYQAGGAGPDLSPDSAPGGHPQTQAPSHDSVPAPACGATHRNGLVEGGPSGDSSAQGLLAPGNPGGLSIP